MLEQEGLQDLIVIKRAAHAEMEHPHGGVWKIAFADFMTAMMCFFLVMWLINAANEDTRQAVAAYFNPVRLAELNKKGLADPHVPSPDQPQDGVRTSEESTPGGPPPAQPEPDRSRDALFSDPYKVLAEIASETPPAPGANASSGAASGAASGVGTGGTAFRDPFDVLGAPSSGGAPPAAPQPPAQQDAVSGATAAPTSAPPPPASNATGGPGQGTSESEQVASASEPGASSAEHGALDETPPPQSLAAQADDAPPISRPVGAIATPPLEAPNLSPVLPAATPPTPAEPDLSTEVAEAVRREAGSQPAPHVSVETTGEGTLISLTDDVDFGMFAIGSAEPQPEMVRVMQRIGEILKNHPGTITIRGHTDARPFRDGSYDNWRLSTDRAEMALYMLVRGGLDEKRVASVEGFADRRLKNSADPDAAENRRIEILVREPAT